MFHVYAIVKTIRYYFFSLFLLLPILTVAGNDVTITGRVNKPHALMRLMVYDDLLNMHETVVAESVADNKGFFSLEGQIDKTVPAAIHVELESVDLVLTPGAAYEVSITMPDIDPSLSYFERPQPALRVKKASDHGLYRQLVVSEMIIDDYVLNYFDQLYQRRQYRYLDSIRAAIDGEFDAIDPYVQQSNTYKIASVQMAVNADGGQKVIKEYFDGKPVLYDCLAYMELFKDLFKNCEMSDDFWKRNPQLAELVTIYQLRGAYYSELPRLRGGIRKKIQTVKDKTKSVEIKLMVTNMLNRFDRFAPGASAVDFALNDMDGRTVKLSDYKDKVVVLQFVEGTSRTVEHQFEVLADLHRQWQDRVQLITITTKDQVASHRRRFEEKHYDWPLLNLGNDILLLEQYEVRTFPEYFIINKGTKIGMAPAPSPDQTLDEYVRGICGE